MYDTFIYLAMLPPLRRLENIKSIDSICISVHSVIFFYDGAVIVVADTVIIFSNVILIFHLIYKT